MIPFVCVDLYTFPGVWERYLLIALFFYLILLVCYLVQSKELRKEPWDRKNNRFREEVVTLCSMESVKSGNYLFLPNLISLLSFSNDSSYKKVLFHDESGKEGFFYDFVTPSKVECFKLLYRAKTEHCNPGISVSSMTFDGDLKVKIRYGENSKVLFEILPIEGVDYSDNQLWAMRCLSRKYLTTDLFKRNITEEKCGLSLSFSLVMAFILFLIAVVISVFFNGTISLVIDALHGGVYVYLLIALPLFICFYKLMGLSFSIPFRYLLCGLKNNDFIREDVRFVATGTISFRGLKCDDLRLLFKEEKVHCFELYFAPLHRRVFYKDQGYNNDDYVCIALGSEKFEILRLFYDINPAENKVRGCYSLAGETTLTMEYNKKMHILKSIAPVEGYEYTEAQLSAIEKFNTLYP